MRHEIEKGIIMHPVFWPFFAFIPLFWIAVVVVVVVLVARRRRAGWGPGPWGPGPWAHGPWGRAAASAEYTLALRFANGDIDEKEYRARLEVLRASRMPDAG